MSERQLCIVDLTVPALIGSNLCRYHSGRAPRPSPSSDVLDPDLHMHFTSAHAGMHYGTFAELVEAHHREHFGPGGIRNHPYESREYSARKAMAVMIECLEM